MCPLGWISWLTAELVYQICGFGLVVRVGMRADMAAAGRLYASSRITRSAGNPRPDPPVRAFYLANVGGGGPVNLFLLGDAHNMAIA